MIQSMTGFGRAASENSSYLVQAEISSLNNRYLEIGLKLPRSVYYYQHAIRDLVKSKIKRGKLTIFMSVSRLADAAVEIEIDSATAKAYRDLSRKLSVDLEIEDNLGTRDLISLDGVLSNSGSKGENEELWLLASEAIEKALAEFKIARQREGQVMYDDISARLEIISSLFADIYAAWEDCRSKRKIQLEERLQKILETTEIKPERMDMEIAMMLDKQDISEEITRFKSHIDLFRDTMNSGNSIGSKLGFVVQEMVREANTISSKSPDSGMTHLVVRIKEEVERIREQIQNVE
jgi:uncharacterized protein (TIGR00255 family)